MKNINYIATVLIAAALFAAAGTASADQQTFSTPGGNQAWTVPSGVSQISVQVWGAGGGGGGGNCSGCGGDSGGGGGGGYASKMVSVTPGQIIYAGVGTGGSGEAGANSGGDGGASYVKIGSPENNPSNPTDADVYATGGKGGNYNTSISVQVGGNGGTWGGNNATGYSGHAGEPVENSSGSPYDFSGIFGSRGGVNGYTANNSSVCNASPYTDGGRGLVASNGSLPGNQQPYEITVPSGVAYGYFESKSPVDYCKSGYQDNKPGAAVGQGFSCTGFVAAPPPGFNYGSWPWASWFMPVYYGTVSFGYTNLNMSGWISGTWSGGSSSFGNCVTDTPGGSGFMGNGGGAGRGGYSGGFGGNGQVIISYTTTAPQSSFCAANNTLKYGTTGVSSANLSPKQAFQITCDYGSQLQTPPSEAYVNNTANNTNTQCSFSGAWNGTGAVFNCPPLYTTGSYTAYCALYDQGTNNGVSFCSALSAGTINVSTGQNPTASIAVTDANGANQTVTAIVSPNVSYPVKWTCGNSDTFSISKAVGGATSSFVNNSPTGGSNPYSSQASDQTLSQAVYTLTCANNSSSATATASVTAVPPSPPSGVTTTAACSSGTSAITLSWQAVTAPSGYPPPTYNIYMNGYTAPIATNISATSYVVNKDNNNNPLTPGTTYQLYVSAVENGVESPWSTSVSAVAASCSSYCSSHQLVSSNVSPMALAPNQNFNVSCDYGSTALQFNAQVNGVVCPTFTGWTGTAANFVCQAPASAGPYVVTCNLPDPTNPPNYCSKSVSNITVSVPLSFSITPPTSISVSQGQQSSALPGSATLNLLSGSASNGNFGGWIADPLTGNSLKTASISITRTAYDTNGNLYTYSTPNIPNTFPTPSGTTVTFNMNGLNTLAAGTYQGYVYDFASSDPNFNSKLCQTFPLSNIGASGNPIIIPEYIRCPYGNIPMFGVAAKYDLSNNSSFSNFIDYVVTPLCKSKQFGSYISTPVLGGANAQYVVCANMINGVPVSSIPTNVVAYNVAEFNITVTNSLTASCSASPTSAYLGDPVTWTANASGGNPPYSYAWYGDAPLAGQTSQNPAVQYSSIGTKYGYVLVTDSNGNVSQGGTGSLVTINGNQYAAIQCSNNVTITDQNANFSVIPNPNSLSMRFIAQTATSNRTLITILPNGLAQTVTLTAGPATINGKAVAYTFYAPGSKIPLTPPITLDKITPNGTQQYDTGVQMTVTSTELPNNTTYPVTVTGTAAIPAINGHQAQTLTQTATVNVSVGVTPPSYQEF